ncbi:ATP-dependent Clp protease proteolytic subunit [bacterium]|nr:ATP-dependent Clp protease proteolytic subunit [bacterium]
MALVEKDEKNSPNIPTLEENHYYIFSSDFDNSSCSDAMSFIIARNLMLGKSRPKCIKMIINSPGGSVPAAFALIDTIKGSKIPVYTYGMGEIASCGLLTFMAGAKGKRFITPNTAILSHQFSWGSMGKEHELMASVREFENTSARIVAHYKKCTGQTEATIKKYLLPPEDVWLTPKEAIKYGLADEIVDFY